jgi:hypothetical protein
MQLLYNPFSFNIDIDRNRRTNYAYYGRYKPTKLKRLMIWIFNERIDPIDWEDVPPYIEPHDDRASLIKSRDGQLHPYECVTQPDMLTKRDVYARRVLLAGFFYCIYRHLEKNQYKYIRINGMNFLYYDRLTLKIFFLAWFYYMACRIFVHRDYQMPYN